MKFFAIRVVFSVLVLFVSSIYYFGCGTLDKDEDLKFSYENDPVVITNPDWNLVPLPTNIMNPAYLDKIGGIVPEAGLPGDTPEFMNLRIVTKDTATRSLDLGYDIVLDSPLTLQLKKSMNKLDGYVPCFVPDIPLSRKVDEKSIVRYQEKDGSDNAETANFFLLDITDEENPKAVAPDDYFLIFDLQMKEKLPYTLTFRLKPKSGVMPENFIQGHTYLVVITGFTEKGIKDVDGNPFVSDSIAQLFLWNKKFIAPDGSPRFNLIEDLKTVQELEMARQVTVHTIKSWKKLVGDKRTLGEIISTFSFTVASNPEAKFVDPSKVVFSQNPMLPKSASGLRSNCKGKILEECVNTGIDFKPEIDLSIKIKKDTVDSNSVALFKKDSEKLKRIETEYEVVNGEDGSKIILSPKSTLDESSAYFVAVNDHIKGENNRIAVADSYFCLVRGENEVVKDDMWMSPFLDYRADTLVAAGKGDQVNKDTVKDAKEKLLRILKLIDELRKDFDPSIKLLLQDGFIKDRMNLILAYEFTTSGCEKVEDKECEMDFGDIGDKDLTDADVTGTFIIKSRLDNPLDASDPINLSLITEMVQDGIILNEGATLTGEMWPESDQSGDGVKPDEPAKIDKDGTFTMTLSNFNIPKSFSDLLASDAIADVVLEGEIYNSDGMKGNISAKLKDADIKDVGKLSLTLSGTFVGKRKLQ